MVRIDAREFEARGGKVDSKLMSNLVWKNQIFKLDAFGDGKLDGKTHLAFTILL